MALRFPVTYSETTDSDDEYSDDFSEYSDQNEYTIEILVDMEFAGAIIGRKGSNIRRMEKQSNATMRLEDGPLSDPEDSLITISGTWESIEKALGLLTETVSSMTDREKKKVLIEGDSESIPRCIMEIREIVIDCPATESSSSGNQQAQSSQVSPASHGSSSGRSVTAFSGQSTSTSATLSNSPNIAGPSSAGTPKGILKPFTLRTPQATALSSADCRAFGELVTTEMQKLNSLHQYQLRNEILVSIAKFKKTEADSRLNEAIDDCSICLDKVKNKTFIGECLHVFCYNCIREWIKMKSTCPICVGGIKSLLYNIRSNDDYDVHKFPDPQPTSSPGSAFVGYASVM